MSVAAVDWALRRAPVGADASARLVLVYLADRADDQGRDAFPSVATLVEQSRLSRSTIKRILRRLEEGGLISRGDQLKVAHYRIDRRPVVWNLHLELHVDNSHSSGGSNWTPAQEPHDSNVSTRGQNEPPLSEELCGNCERGFTGEHSGGSYVNHKPSNKPSLYPLYPPQGDDNLMGVSDDEFSDEPFEEALDPAPDDENSFSDSNEEQGLDSDAHAVTELMCELRDHVGVQLPPFKSERSQARFERNQVEAAQRLVSSFGFQRVCQAARWVFDSRQLFWKGVAFTPERLERNWTQVASQMTELSRSASRSWSFLSVSMPVPRSHEHSRGCEHVQHVLGYTNPGDCLLDPRSMRVLDLLKSEKSVQQIQTILDQSHRELAVQARYINVFKGVNDERI